MAYFASGRAALTGTDKATRLSIAQGKTSAYFMDSSGKKTPRGVVQLDAIMGNDLRYGAGLTLKDRVSSAMGYYRRAEALKKKTRQTSVNDASVVSLHEGSSGTIETSKTFGFPIKTIGIILGVGIIGYLVVNR